MATDITMPQMGFDMTEGTVANWLKKVGDPVKKGEAIAEIETDKTTIQVEAFAGGVLLAINTPAGGKVPVNTVIGVIGEPGEKIAASKVDETTAPAPKPATPSPQPPAASPQLQASSPQTPATGATAIEMPQMGFDMTEGTVANWLKREGDAIKKGEAIAEIETDKTTIQVEAFSSGTLLKILVPAGQKVPVKTVIAYLGDPGAAMPAASGSSAQTAAPAAVGQQPVASGPLAGGPVDATPVARRMAEENNIDLRSVKGSGPDGRITKGDVEAHLASAKSVQSVAASPRVSGRVIASPYAKKLAAERGVELAGLRGSGPNGRVMADDVKAAQPVAKAAPAAQAAAAAQPVAAAAKPAPIAGKKPFTRIRQTIARRMTESKTQVPHYYLTMQVEMDAALALRAQYNESVKTEGIKVSVNDMVVKAAAGALRKFPNFNASFAGDGIELREQINIGIAVAMDDGLIVITLKDADKKTLKQIGAEVPVIAARVREGKAQPGDLGGQTFTTSNLGMYGVESVVPIINMPDSAILGIGASTPTAVVRDGQIVARNIMHLTLAGDHRVTDGAAGAQFVAEIKRLLEAPWNLVM